MGKRNSKTVKFSGYGMVVPDCSTTMKSNKQVGEGKYIKKLKDSVKTFASKSGGGAPNVREIGVTKEKSSFRHYNNGKLWQRL